MLTDTRIRNTKPGTKAKKLSDSHGLYLEVTPAGGRLWRYRFRLDGSEKAFVIGRYPDIGLAEAREQRDAARKLVSQGLNPTHSRKLDQIKRQNERRWDWNGSKRHARNGHRNIPEKWIRCCEKTYFQSWDRSRYDRLPRRQLWMCSGVSKQGEHRRKRCSQDS